MFIGFGLWASFDSYHKAENYARLQSEHAAKRARILSQLQSLENQR